MSAINISGYWLRTLARAALSMGCAGALLLTIGVNDQAQAQTIRPLSKNWYHMPYTDGTGVRISSSNTLFDGGHNGYDMSASPFVGFPSPYMIAAAADGTVISALDSNNVCGSGGCNNSIWIAHANGEFSAYYHIAFASALVDSGDQVFAGQPIATEGDVGITGGAGPPNRLKFGCDGVQDPQDTTYCGIHVHFAVTREFNTSMAPSIQVNPRICSLKDLGYVLLLNGVVDADDNQPCNASPCNVWVTHQGVLADTIGAVQSDTWITSTAEIENSVIGFQAQDSILLLPGFHARSGSYFRAEIGDCNASPTSLEKSIPVTDYRHLKKEKTNLAVDQKSMSFKITSGSISSKKLTVTSLIRNPLDLLVSQKSSVSDRADIQPGSIESVPRSPAITRQGTEHRPISEAETVPSDVAGQKKTSRNSSALVAIMAGTIPTNAWLSHDVASATISGHGQQKITVTVDATRLDPGTYERTLLLADGENTISVDVTLEVVREPVAAGAEINDASTEALPSHFALGPNMPNPFNPSTTIKYALKNNVYVSLKVFNLLGQEVRTLVDEYQSAAYREVIWDGKDETGRLSPSGMYFYRIVAGNFVKTQRMTMLK